MITWLLHRFGPPLPHDLLHQAPAFAIVLATLWLMTRRLPAGSVERLSLARFSFVVGALLMGFFSGPFTPAWRAVVSGPGWLVAH